MHSSLPAPNNEQKERFRKLYSLGCICCRNKGIRTEAQIHHLLRGHYRAGHDWTIPLCPYHHTGEGWQGYTVSMVEPVYGKPGPPGGYKFKQDHGKELDLLQQVNELLDSLPDL